MTKRVKIFTDIPDEQKLTELIADYKDSGAKVGWTRQLDGRFRLEAVFEETSLLPMQEKFSSPITGQSLFRG